MQKFVVELVGVFTQKDLPEDYNNFVQYRLKMDQRELTLTERIAVLRIKNTTSYHILFLDDYKDMDEIDKEIEERLDGQLYNFNARQIIEGHLNARN